MGMGNDFDTFGMNNVGRNTFNTNLVIAFRFVLILIEDLRVQLAAKGKVNRHDICFFFVKVIGIIAKGR